MTRIFYDPSHQHYQPCRRCWVILNGLYGNDLTDLDRSFAYEWSFSWDRMLSDLLSGGMADLEALRTVVQRILDCVPD